MVPEMIIAEGNQAPGARSTFSRKVHVVRTYVDSYLWGGRRKILLLVLATRKQDEQVRQPPNERLHRAASVFELRDTGTARSNIVLNMLLLLGSQSQHCASISMAVRWQQL